jgi:hypothetical protein
MLRLRSSDPVLRTISTPISSWCWKTFGVASMFPLPLATGGCCLRAGVRAPAHPSILRSQAWESAALLVFSFSGAKHTDDHRGNRIGNCCRGLRCSTPHRRNNTQEMRSPLLYWGRGVTTRAMGGRIPHAACPNKWGAPSLRNNGPPPWRPHIGRPIPKTGGHSPEWCRTSARGAGWLLGA